MQLVIPPPVPENSQRPASAGAELRARAAESRAQQAQQAPAFQNPGFPAMQLQPEQQGAALQLGATPPDVDVRTHLVSSCVSV